MRSSLKWELRAADERQVHEMLQALRIPAFGRLAATYTLNDLAHFMATIALSILVYDATGDALATTALFLAAEFLPAAVVPALTARLERLSPARVLAGAYVLEALLLGAIAAVAGAPWLPLILVLAFLNGTLATLARAVTRSSSVALLEPRGALRAGNAVMNVGFALVSALGPAAAGGLVALFDPGPTLAIAAGAFAALAAFIGSSALPAGPLDVAPWQHRLGEAIEHVRSHPVLRTLLVGQGLALMLLTMVVPIQVIYAKDSLGTGDAGFGLFAAAWGAGIVIGSAVFARERNRPIPQLVTGSTTALALGYLGIAAAPTLAVACVVAILGGIGNGIQNVAVLTAVQEATEERFQARVAGLLEAVATAAPGAGFLLGGLVTALLSPRTAFAVAGGGVLLLLIVGLAVLRRTRSVNAAEPVLDPA